MLRTVTTLSEVLEGFTRESKTVTVTVHMMSAKRQ